MQNQDPVQLLKTLAEQGRSIKFAPGVVGKTGYATVALFGLWGIILFRISENAWLNVTLLIGGFVATGIYCWWVRSTQKFAADNPGLAMLEGAQLIEYQKWEAEIKGLPKPLGGQVIPGPDEEASR